MPEPAGGGASTAAEVSFASEAGIGSGNVQGALVELAGDVGTVAGGIGLDDRRRPCYSEGMAIRTYTDTTRTTVAPSAEALRKKDHEDRISQSGWEAEENWGGTERGNFGLEETKPLGAHETTCTDCGMVVNRHTMRDGFCASCADDLGL